LPYLGMNYPMRIVNNHHGEDKIKLADREFLIFSSNHSKKQVKNLYEKWLMQKAKYVFGKKVKRYSNELGIEPSRITIKNLKNRWGSLTKDNVINLNVNLLKAPHDIIDYMVLHELCHLKIKEHSHHFWELVNRFIPNYQEKEDWLKVNANNLNR
jgi:predicted metal-dependent hydrolase